MIGNTHEDLRQCWTQIKEKWFGDSRYPGTRQAMPDLRLAGSEQYFGTLYCEGSCRGARETVARLCRNRGVVLEHLVDSYRCLIRPIV
jgi:hypothetical protein